MQPSIRVEEEDMEQGTKTNSAAALMVLLGDDLTADIMSHLTPSEVVTLSTAIIQISGRESEYADQLDQLLDMHGFPKATPTAS